MTGSSPAEHGSDAVVVEQVELGYGGRPVLRNVSFRVGRGEVFAVIGPSGCGKSTLLKGLVGLKEAWRGRIEIAGELVSAGDPAALHDRLAPHIGVLFQSTALLGELTVADNVAMPLRRVAADLPESLVHQTVQLALDLVHMGKHGGAWPATLSGGMKRRVGLARAMVLNPTVLFCDEPSAGLDPSTAREIDLLLRQLNRQLGVTVVLVTHELECLANLAQRCIMLEADGSGIIASGSYHEVRSADDARVRDFFHRHIDDGRSEGAPEVS